VTTDLRQELVKDQSRHGHEIRCNQWTGGSNAYFILLFCSRDVLQTLNWTHQQ